MTLKILYIRQAQHVPFAERVFFCSDQYEVHRAAMISHTHIHIHTHTHFHTCTRKHSVCKIMVYFFNNTPTNSNFSTCGTVLLKENLLA